MPLKLTLKVTTEKNLNLFSCLFSPFLVKSIGEFIEFDGESSRWRNVYWEKYRNKKTDVNY